MKLGKKMEEVLSTKKNERIHLLVAMLVWSREREQHSVDVYGGPTSRCAKVYAAFIHNAYCLVDSHIGSRTLGAHVADYERLFGFRFARHAHTNDHTTPGDRPCMSEACLHHVREFYWLLCQVLFDEHLGSVVFEMLRARYWDRTSYDAQPLCT